MKIAVFLLVLLVGLALASPGRALTESNLCVAALRGSALRHRNTDIPADCWRLGPLRLGMSRLSVEGLLGGPDTGRDFTRLYRHRRYFLSEAVYVYPRNLKSWLRLAPQAAEDFHPVTLHLIYRDNVVVAIAVGDLSRTQAPGCVPPRPVRPFQRGGRDFPYDFHGIRLGTPLGEVGQRFGRFATVNAARDFRTYWPVPLSFDGDDGVTEIDFATGMAFAGTVGMPDFELRRDPATCLVTGYAVSMVD